MAYGMNLLIFLLLSGAPAPDIMLLNLKKMLAAMALIHIMKEVKVYREKYPIRVQPKVPLIRLLLFDLGEGSERSDVEVEDLCFTFSPGRRRRDRGRQRGC